MQNRNLVPFGSFRGHVALRHPAPGAREVSVEGQDRAEPRERHHEVALDHLRGDALAGPRDLAARICVNKTLKQKAR